LESGKLAKKSLILAYSLLYLEEPALPKLGFIILGFALGLDLGLGLDFILGLNIGGI
jgi:hypothetical protein